MANLKETTAWESGIYQLETTDPVVGGADGISNKQAIQLANRTSYLKGKIESLESNSNEKLALKRDISDSYSASEVNALIAPKLDSAIAEATYLTKQESNYKFTHKTDFANYKDAEGYTKLPNGLIIQWGRIGIPAGGRARVTYPIVFPNARLMLFIGSLIDAASNSNGTGGYHRPGNFDNDRTGFDVVGMYGYTASYIAIGH